MAKGDFISRSALLKELRQELRVCKADADEFGGENILWAEGIEFAIDTVKNAKAVDSDNDKHGRWLPQIVFGQRVWSCSECATLGSPQWKRCPVCEAKMDRGVGDGNKH